MEFLTPEEKLKEKKLYRNIYILLCILPLIAFGTIFGYFLSQKSLVNKANDAIRAGQIEEAKAYAMQLDDMQTHDNNTETILMVACENGCSEIIEWALAHGADPNYAPRGATSPLELYCSFGFRGGAKTLSRLLQAGADVKNYQFKPPMFCLAERLLYMTSEEREIAFAEMLILYHNGDKIQYDNTTLLHYVAQYDDEALAKALLSTVAGAKQLGMLNTDGKTPYDLALQNGSAKVQRVIRQFQEGLLDALENEDNPEDINSGEDEYTYNQEEMDALINSLEQQSQKSQQETASTEEPTTP